ncbi:MAG: NADH:flavin oxidoreductase [Desulfobacterales bacterium]|jgi:2,4-dienoyl-CoA reductase-like NADH-dependent reductase (Old Yellow Enzyme family)|nr:NADH:flavin oxidoreductase [Desulfobacterales bacterium]
MKRLFEQSEINGMVLSNRFVRSATWEGLATDDGASTSKLVDLMARLAAGGVGLIITGHTYVRPDGQHSPWQLGIYKDELIPGLKAMTQGVHENGAKIVLQLGYGGAYLSKSRVAKMTVADIQDLVTAYGIAAARAKIAGFDGVQIFAAHGFFLSQLLCPRYNDRTDAYGGNIRNRARALLEVLQSVRNHTGDDYPVLVKLNCQDFVENGLSLEDSLQVGMMLDEEGIDAIELSGGLLNNPNIMQSKIDTEAVEAHFQNEARAFKEKIAVPLILVGGIRSLAVAKRLVDEGVADYISMSRPFIRDPDLINRWKAGDLMEAECISCNNCFEQIKQGKGVSCVPLAPEPVESFFPQISKTVPASPPHPPGTGYQISIGLEQWDSDFIPVAKIQMVYKGNILDRGPSFPLGSVDHQNVNKAISKLLEEYAAGTTKK